MERIYVYKGFKPKNPNTRFEMIFEGKADTKKALEAMREVIDPNKYDDPYMLAFSPLFIQDLGDNRTDSGFVFDSSLGSGEYDKFIPAMIKAVAKALPDASFKGSSKYDDTRCFFVHDFDFSYNGKQLYIKETIMDDDNGYFCPHCGFCVAFPNDKFISDEIECEECEEIIKVSELKYVSPFVKEEVIEF